MPTSLKQRRGWQTDTFMLEPEGVRVRVKRTGGVSEVLINYAVIPAKSILNSFPRRWPIGTGFLCFLLAIVPFGVLAAMSEQQPWVERHFTHLSVALLMVLILIELALTYIYFFHQIHLRIFPLNDSQLVFLINKPSRQEVDAFLESMHREKINHLVRRIKRLQELDAEFQFGPALANLLNNGIITEAQCTELEKILLADGSTPIGFGSGH